jgi:predicted metal-dependent HD superfamily phosphohydrolase
MIEHDLEVPWQRHVSGDRRLLDGLLARHREKHRRYHTATHVAWVIRHIEELAATEPVEHLGEVIAAAFYHDAVYEPTYPANERASARLARRDLATIGWDPSAIDRVAAMIEATEHGAADSALDSAEALPTDTTVLLDADLAVLGADPAGYSTYAAGVRGEYRHLGDEEWRVGRRAVLEGFLHRPTIYLTDTAVALWERRARANLTAELAELEA